MPENPWDQAHRGALHMLQEAPLSSAQHETYRCIVVPRRTQWLSCRVENVEGSWRAVGKKWPSQAMEGLGNDSSVLRVAASEMVISQEAPVSREAVAALVTRLDGVGLWNRPSSDAYDPNATLLFLERWKDGRAERVDALAVHDALADALRTMLGWVGFELAG